MLYYVPDSFPAFSHCGINCLEEETPQKKNNGQITTEIEAVAKEIVR